MSVDKLWQQLRHAADWQSAFSPLAQHSASGLKQRYRELAALVHPDLHPTQQAQALEAFQLLQQWYAVAQSALAQRASVPRVEITARTGHYQIVIIILSRSGETTTVAGIVTRYL